VVAAQRVTRKGAASSWHKGSCCGSRGVCLHFQPSAGLILLKTSQLAFTVPNRARTIATLILSRRDSYEFRTDLSH
jgi:hypothetical protein